MTRRTAPPGPTAYGKGRDRDAVRSSRPYTAWRYGHEWVAPAVLVQFPFPARRRASPAPANSYRAAEVRKADGVRHRTPARQACR